MTYLIPDTLGIDEETGGSHVVPVPCKCCGKVHPECGCWLYRNKKDLVGHLCWTALDNHRPDPRMIVWDSKYPGQQRSALYFHADRLRRAELDVIIYLAATKNVIIYLAATKNIKDEGEFSRRALKIASERLSSAIAQANESLVFLDTNDVTGKLHTLSPDMSPVGER